MNLENVEDNINCMSPELYRLKNSIDYTSPELQKLIKFDWMKLIDIEKSNSFGIGIILLQMNLLLDQN